MAKVWVPLVHPRAEEVGTSTALREGELSNFSLAALKTKSKTYNRIHQQINEHHLYGEENLGGYALFCTKEVK